MFSQRIMDKASVRLLDLTSKWLYGNEVKSDCLVRK